MTTWTLLVSVAFLNANGTPSMRSNIAPEFGPFASKPACVSVGRRATAEMTRAAHKARFGWTGPAKFSCHAGDPFPVIGG
jgi:hypothetical protein